MKIRLRTLLPILVTAMAVVVAGCGGGGSSADEGTDVNELLEQTFSGDKKVDSGRLDLTLRIDSQGGDSQLQGPISLKLAGPFETQGQGKLPLFDMDATFEGAGQSIKAGLASTGDKGFVNFQGTDYVVSDQVFQQFRASFEQAQKEAAGEQKDQQSLATLGIDPRRWLTDAKNAGEAKVGDTDTIKITGGVDVAKLLDDVNVALEKARGLGVEGSDSLPEKLTDEQKRQAAEAVENLAVEIYTGKDDTTLRRMLVKMDVAGQAGGEGAAAQSGTLALDFSLLELNEGQEIAAPKDPQPFDQLLGQLGSLGLGGAGGAGGASGSGDSGASGAGASAEDLKQYSDCIETAGDDVAKAQKCAELLTP